MANRVLLGNRSGSLGIFVSRPGYNVLTAGPDELLMSTDLQNLQVMHSGSFSTSGGSTGVSWPAFGFRPYLLVQGVRGITSITYTSSNSATIVVGATQPNLNALWNVGSVPSLSTAIYWSVLNVAV